MESRPDVRAVLEESHAAFELVDHERWCQSTIRDPPVDDLAKLLLGFIDNDNRRHRRRRSEMTSVADRNRPALIDSNPRASASLPRRFRRRDDRRGASSLESAEPQLGLRPTPAVDAQNVFVFLGSCVAASRRQHSEITDCSCSLCPTQLHIRSRVLVRPVLRRSRSKRSSSPHRRRS